MTGYIVNFGVYTMAMIGIIVIAMLVYKKSSEFSTTNKNSLKIDDKIALNARKSLYVVNANGERFLIAGDMDNTSLIAKLGENEVPQIETYSKTIQKTEPKQYITRSIPTLKKDNSEAQKALDSAFASATPITTKVKGEKYLDLKAIRKKPVMKELARKLAQV